MQYLRSMQYRTAIINKIIWKLKYIILQPCVSLVLDLTLPCSWTQETSYCTVDLLALLKLFVPASASFPSGWSPVSELNRVFHGTCCISIVFGTGRRRNDRTTYNLSETGPIESLFRRLLWIFSPVFLRPKSRQRFLWARRSLFSWNFSYFQTLFDSRLTFLSISACALSHRYEISCRTFFSIKHHWSRGELLKSDAINLDGFHIFLPSIAGLRFNNIFLNMLGTRLWDNF